MKIIGYEIFWIYFKKSQKSQKKYCTNILIYISL